MAKRNAIEDKVFTALEIPIGEMGFELIDVIYRKENGKLFLRLLVDKAGGITIDECALINEKFDSYIEQELGINRHDYFEVSSPGLERPLTSDKEFKIYQGALVDVKLYQKRENKKLFTGNLLKGDAKGITIKEENSGREMFFERRDIAKILRTIRFESF